LLFIPLHQGDEALITPLLENPSEPTTQVDDELLLRRKPRLGPVQGWIHPNRTMAQTDPED
jgi:hypothetical protein